MSTDRAAEVEAITRAIQDARAAPDQNWDEVAAERVLAALDSLRASRQERPPDPMPGRSELDTDYLEAGFSLVKEGEQLTAEEAQIAATAIADVWIIQGNDEPEPHAATLLHRKLRRLASGKTDGD